jgi:condensin-2 complex subunit D3
MVACSDHDESVSKLAETTLCGPLLSKQPNLFFNNFVESLFVLNGCTAHPIYTAAAVSGDGGSGFAVDFGLNLSGQEHAHRRHDIYHMMISHLTDEEKIGITARLSKEVLGGALESMGDLSLACRRNPQPFAPDAQLSLNEQRHKSAFSVLSDAFTILSSSDMRVGKRAHNDDDEEEGESTPTDGPAAAQLAAVKGRLLSKISRKHLIETVVPILCNLKTVLQESRSCLLKDLMRYLVEIFRLYKVEIKELLASDPTLLQELEYDTRQFEKSRQKQPEAFDGEMSTDEPHVISESP